MKPRRSRISSGAGARCRSGSSRRGRARILRRGCRRCAIRGGIRRRGCRRCGPVRRRGGTPGVRCRRARVCRGPPHPYHHPHPYHPYNPPPIQHQQNENINVNNMSSAQQPSGLIPEDSTLHPNLLSNVPPNELADIHHPIENQQSSINNNITINQQEPIVNHSNDWSNNTVSNVGPNGAWLSLLII